MKTRDKVACAAVSLTFVFGVTAALAGGTDPYGREDPNKKVLKQGLLGAATGAIAAEASGGEAGTGALVGAGTNVIGGALLDTLTTPSTPAPQPVYYQQAPAQAGPAGSAQPQPVYYQEPPPQQAFYTQPAYPPQPDPTQKILKQGLLGAGTGAIAASASGGKAGKGALIGAGTNIIGGALLDAITTPSQPAPQPVYYQQPQSYYGQQSNQPRRRIIRKYDAEGNAISEEEVYD